MKTKYTYEQLIKMHKKQVVQACGYNNMKALCEDNPDLVKSHKKGPSKKTLIRMLT